MCVYVSVCPANHAWTTSNRTELVGGQEGIRQDTVADRERERHRGERWTKRDGRSVAVVLADWQVSGCCLLAGAIIDCHAAKDDSDGVMGDVIDASSGVTISDPRFVATGSSLSLSSSPSSEQDCSSLCFLEHERLDPFERNKFWGSKSYALRFHMSTERKLIWKPFEPI